MYVLHFIESDLHFIESDSMIAFEGSYGDYNLYNEFLTIKCKIRIQETKIGSKEPMIIYLHDLSNRQICMTVDGIAQN